MNLCELLTCCYDFNFSLLKTIFDENAKGISLINFQNNFDTLYIYIYLYVCLCIYLFVYLYVCLCIYI